MELRDTLHQLPLRKQEGLLRLSGQGETINITVTMVAAPVNKAYTISLNSESLSVPNAVLPKLFEPFQPIELPSGTISLSLGLPLARAIILGHGGTCGASQHAAGLSLWLTMPC